ncbi:MAG TPA: hypothetical protein VET66_10645, partial [Steroidobacteraceae bacterium]|nr:hypothetical protein [Steroidobacteraceae bacterium]
PENRILSHDLLEGCYARSGLASDVQLYEEYPARYGADMARRHRWMRGDWQLAGWLLRKVPGGDGARERNPLPGLAQWKIFDNLRRSLVAPALTGMLLLGWAVLPIPGLWTLAALAVTLVPALGASLVELFDLPAGASLRHHLAGVLHAAAGRLGQSAFALALLPFEASVALDAILRTGVRMLVTQRRLLEWTASTRPDPGGAGSLAAAFRSMWIAPCLSIATTTMLAFERPGALAVALPVLLLWAASPLLIWWLDQPLAHPEARLSPAQTALLRLVARKTWAYFEMFAGANDHWLPPDNFQQAPVEAIAHRTSPTNMGLALLASLSAHDFGYLPTERLLDRLRDALGTMQGLERYRGHFYNWYDTQTLQPLPPAYVSTVDSGNLAGHLLTLRAGLAQLPDQPILPARWLEGLEDTYKALLDAAPAAASVALLRFQEAIEAAQAARPTTLAAARETLQHLAALALHILERLGERDGAEALAWARALEEQCRAFGGELALFPELPAARSGDAVPTLRRLAAQGVAQARQRMDELARLAVQAAELACLDYDFLYDEVRHLLAIGYNLPERRR